MDYSKKHYKSQIGELCPVSASQPRLIVHLECILGVIEQVESNIVRKSDWNFSVQIQTSLLILKETLSAFKVFVLFQHL